MVDRIRHQHYIVLVYLNAIATKESENVALSLICAASNHNTLERSVGQKFGRIFKRDAG